MKTHIPHCSWCAHCIKGRATRFPQVRRRKTRTNIFTQRLVMCSSWEHPCNLRQNEGTKSEHPEADPVSNPILVSGGESGDRCGKKGQRRTRLRSALQAGWMPSAVTLKCDNEPAIFALTQEIRRLRSCISISWSRATTSLRKQHGIKSEHSDRPVSSADTVDH